MNGNLVNVPKEFMFGGSDMVVPLKTKIKNLIKEFLKELEELEELGDKMLQYGLRPDITEISICDHDIEDCISAFLMTKGFDVNIKSKRIIEDTLCDAFDRNKGLPKDMKEFFKKWGLI